MSNAKMLAAKELIQEKNYALARALLLTVKDDPTAKQWIAKIDQIAPQQYGDPFAGISKKRQNTKPVRYEHKTVSIQAGILQNLDAMVDKRIAKMEDDGWEFVDQKEKIGGMSPKGRVLQFRRPKQ